MKALEQLGGYSCGGIVGNRSFGPPFTSWPQNLLANGGGFRYLKDAHLEFFCSLYRDSIWLEIKFSQEVVNIHSFLWLPKTCFAMKANSENWMNQMRLHSLPGFAWCIGAYPIIDMSKCCTQCNNKAIILQGAQLVQGVALCEPHSFSHNKPWNVNQQQRLILPLFDLMQSWLGWCEPITTSNTTFL